ncbi:MAG: methyltransferase domain-containing protein [Solirubrobacteraceae bacterium]
MSIDVSGIKEGQRNMWTIGDYPDIARTLTGVAETILARAEAGPGVSLLDVATGAGNVAIPAALAGADVTGLDLTPRLLEVARERAAEAGAEVSFVEGDAEELPFEADSFDRVTSCFGVMFAPRQELAASELARVARPGATIVVTAWTPEGLNGQMFKTVGSYMPSPPPELKPPVMWGNEDHVRSLFEPTGAELTYERHMVTFEHDSAVSWFEYNERVLGPTIMAKAALEPQGRWDALREDLVKLYTDANEAGAGAFRVRAEYLLTVARMPS